MLLVAIIFCELLLLVYAAVLQKTSTVDKIGFTLIPAIELIPREKTMPWKEKGGPKICM